MSARKDCERKDCGRRKQRWTKDENTLIFPGKR